MCKYFCSIWHIDLWYFIRITCFTICWCCRDISTQFTHIYLIWITLLKQSFFKKSWSSLTYYTRLYQFIQTFLSRIITFTNSKIITIVNIWDYYILLATLSRVGLDYILSNHWNVSGFSCPLPFSRWTFSISWLIGLRSLDADHLYFLTFYHTLSN